MVLRRWDMPTHEVPAWPGASFYAEEWDVLTAQDPITPDGVSVRGRPITINIQLLPELETSQSLEMQFNQGLRHPQQN